MTDAIRGRFITLEGGEGAGKSVQAKRLEDKLKSFAERSRSYAKSSANGGDGARGGE